MQRVFTRICLFAAFLPILAVISQGSALAATAPAVTSLGQIRDGMVTSTRVGMDTAGHLYVADPYKRSVVKFDKYGKRVATFDKVPLSGSGLAVTPDGTRLYVAAKTAVAMVSGADGSLIGYLGGAPGQFQHVADIAMDANGFIFVADAGTLLVKVYNPAGGYVYQFGGKGDTPGKFRGMVAIGIDSAAGRVYVADSNYVGTTSAPKVQAFTLGGSHLQSFDGATAFGTAKITYFSGLTFDPAGRFYVFDSFASKMNVYGVGATLTQLLSYGSPGFKVGMLNGPNDAVFDPSTNRLFVACEDGRVEIFGIDGGTNPVKLNVKPGLPAPVSPVADSMVATPTPVLEFSNAVDPDGDVLTYDVRLFRDGAQVAEYLRLPQGKDLSSAQVAQSLVENARYGWAVQAFDGVDASGWTAQQTFYVNALAEAPTVPTPLSPLEGEGRDGEGLLSWTPSSDPDPFDQVSYLVEVAVDAAFTAPGMATPASGTSLGVGELADFSALEPGVTCFWRVRAVDASGLTSAPSAAGSFVYDGTVLKVTANVPDARVYLGGNHAYAGEFVGIAPVELRDLPAGVRSVVVERGGFEPFVAQATLARGSVASVVAALVPAILPADLKAKPLTTADGKLSASGAVAPLAVDFDSDGVTDLLIADGAGALTLYPGLPAGSASDFGTARKLALTVAGGSSLFVADWDNDGRKDLLTGEPGGAVRLYRNVGTETAPAFGAAEDLFAGGTVVGIPKGQAVPVVFDIDGDLDKDLVVGGGDGQVYKYINAKGEGAPELTAPVALFAAPFPAPAAPFFADWDGDGSRDLLVAAGASIYLCAPLEGGSYAVAAVVTGGAGESRKKGNSPQTVLALGDGLRLFALDLDGKKGKDLLIGNAAGELALVNSFGKTVAKEAGEALVNKLEAMTALPGGEMVVGLGAQLRAGSFVTAADQAAALQLKAGIDADLARELGELAALCRQM